MKYMPQGKFKLNAEGNSAAGAAGLAAGGAAAAFHAKANALRSII